MELYLLLDDDEFSKFDSCYDQSLAEYTYGNFTLYLIGKKRSDYNNISEEELLNSINKKFMIRRHAYNPDIIGSSDKYIKVNHNTKNKSNSFSLGNSDVIIIIENYVKKIITNYKGLMILKDHFNKIINVDSGYTRIYDDNGKLISNKIEYHNFDKIQPTIVTAVTSNITYQNTSRLVKSAVYNGHDIILEDKTKSWNGFGTKVDLLIKGLNLCNDDIVILIDSTDTFINSPYLLDKYLSMSCDVVVSGELELWYYNNGNTKKYLDQELSWFEKVSSGKYPYPNAGFFMGKVKYLKYLMNYMKGCNDDQYETINILYDHKHTYKQGKFYINSTDDLFTMCIDTENKLIATLARYYSTVPHNSTINNFSYDKLISHDINQNIKMLCDKAANTDFVDWGFKREYRTYRVELLYEYDIKMGRYKYKDNLCAPAAFHYPNKNNQVFDLMFSQVYDENQSPSKSKTCYSWTILTVAISLVLLIFFILFIMFA